MPDPNIDMPLFLAGAGAGIGGVILAVERGLQAVIRVRGLMNGGVAETKTLAALGTLTEEVRGMRHDINRKLDPLHDELVRLVDRSR